MKSTKTSYSYVVLRYMHDVFTREFVNVAILLHAPGAGFLGFKKLPALDRVKGMFPGLQSDSLRALLTFLASRAEELQNRSGTELFDCEIRSAETVARTLLPTDDSALQWSDPGGGISDDPRRTLDDLFERLVTHHQKPHPIIRRDDDVWRPFENELRARNVLYKLQEKVLSVGELRHRFDNSWQPQDGYLRVFQPLSFDLLQCSDIVEKGVRWSALIKQLRKTNPDFKIYLLVGAPADSKSRPAFEQAIEALQEDGGERKELVAEQDVPQVAAKVEHEIKSFAN